jgi:hypothetical protein
VLGGLEAVAASLAVDDATQWSDWQALWPRRSPGRSAAMWVRTRSTNPTSAVVIPQDLHHARRLDLRPLVDRSADDWLERISIPPGRAHSAAASLASSSPTVGPVDPNRLAIPRCKTPVGDHRPHLNHSTALGTSSPPRQARYRRARGPDGIGQHRPDGGALFSPFAWRGIGLLASGASPVGAA